MTLAPALASALQEVARAIGADACSLVEFGEDRDVTAMLTWPEGDPKIGPLGRMDGLPRWLLNRLTRHEVVAVSSVDDLPHRRAGAGTTDRRLGRVWLCRFSSRSRSRARSSCGPGERQGNGRLLWSNLCERLPSSSP